MCGIAGVVGPAANAARGAVEAMATALMHRGPDSGGFFLDTNVALASRRLRIVDIAGSHQPMLSANGKQALVFNGEIYGFQAIRKQFSE